MSSKIGVYYYSERCANCRKISRHMQHLSGMLELSCVDRADVKQRVPASVTSVPTLVVVSEGRMLVGLSEISPWIRTTLSGMKNKLAASKKGVSTTNESGGDPFGTCDDEWGASYSDSYSFIENTSPLMHSYASLHGESNGHVATNEATPCFKSQSMEPHASSRNADVSTRMEQFIADRDRDLRV